jgi:hypothetical protein
MKNKYILFSIFSSFLIHTVLFVQANKLKFDLSFSKEKDHRINLKSIRKVGVKEGRESLNILSKKKKVSLSDLRAQAPVAIAREKIPQPVKPAIKKLALTNDDILTTLKKPSKQIASATKVLQSINDTDVLIDLEVPKGVPEDELNKHELVFYSFQKRTIHAYINSFRKELQNFERKNPHLNFPVTRKQQEIQSRVTYDENGDILKIETVRWTDEPKLQEFFMEVVKNMTSLPNPPEQIIDGDKFVINYVFSVNN